MPKLITGIISNHLVPSADYIYGFADLHGLLDNLFREFSYGISIGKKLEDEIIDKLEAGPTLEYYHYYNRVNDELTVLSRNIEYDLQKAGIKAMAVIPTIYPGNPGYEEYMKTLSYDLSHKMVATRAGLGWIGKTDLLVTKSFGPRLRLVSILLDRHPGKVSIPVEKSKCGKCNVCVEKCPASAANGKSWTSNLHRDKFFNARKCREKCAELARQKLNVDERICGMCLYVCPIGKN